jgi:molecular chaperone IbpA
MRSYDFSPLWRSTIGFDRLFDLAQSAQRATEDNYPPSLTKINYACRAVG